jgi:hypothetical protein
MSIIKYQVLNPVITNKEPYYDAIKELFVFPTQRAYRYYVEAALEGRNGGKEYYLLLGITPFDKNVRKCQTDMYGRCKIRVRGEIKEFIISETSFRGNITLTYMESTDDYDVYCIE